MVIKSMKGKLSEQFGDFSAGQKMLTDSHFLHISTTDGDLVRNSQHCFILLLIIEPWPFCSQRQWQLPGNGGSTNGLVCSAQQMNVHSF